MVQITSKPAVKIPADIYNAVAKPESHISGEEVGGATIVVKQQAEEVGKRAPEKLCAQKNLKLKTRARLTSAPETKKQEGTRVKIRLC